MQIPAEELIELLENKTELVGLDPQYRLLVLDSLNLSTILSFHVHDDYYSQIAEDVFKRKYSHKIIKIVDPVLIGLDEIPEEDDTVHIKQFGEILRVLKIFGHLITRLWIEYNQYRAFGVDMAPIVKYVNLYCANTLIEFNVVMNSDYTEFFDEMTKSFEHVEQLSISGRFNKLTSSTLSFVEMFPSVRSLSLDYVQVLDKNGLDLKFLNLTHLNVEIDNSRFTSEDIENILRANPKIQRLELGRGDLAILKVASEVLHDLESLELMNFFGGHYSDDDNERIVFENVKYFSVDGNIPEIVDFKNLTEFYLTSFLLSDGEWIDFVAQNTNLLKLSVNKCQINNSQLQRLTEMELNLVKISLFLNFSVEDKTIASFVRKSGHMKKINFNKPFALKSAAELLRNEFGNEWNVTLCQSESESKVTLEHY